MTTEPQMPDYEKGERDYKADVRARPLYHDGTPRPSWPQLGTIGRQSWARVPRQF